MVGVVVSVTVGVVVAVVVVVSGGVAVGVVVAVGVTVGVVVSVTVGVVVSVGSAAARSVMTATRSNTNAPECIFVDVSEIIFPAETREYEDYLKGNEGSKEETAGRKMGHNEKEPNDALSLLNPPRTDDSPQLEAEVDK